MNAASADLQDAVSACRAAAASARFAAMRAAGAALGAVTEEDWRLLLERYPADLRIVEILRALPLSPAAVITGPNRGNGPAPGAWTITSSKSDGVTPGFTVKDATGQRWFLKFDPPGHRGMATGTEVAVTKLM